MVAVLDMCWHHAPVSLHGKCDIFSRDLCVRMPDSWIPGLARTPGSQPWALSVFGRGLQLFNRWVPSQPDCLDFWHAVELLPRKES